MLYPGSNKANYHPERIKSLEKYQKLREIRMMNEDGLIEQRYLFVVVGECVMPFTDLILLSEAGSTLGIPACAIILLLNGFFV